MSSTLKLHKPEPIPEVVEHLENLLEEAKAGGITAIAYAVERREGWVGQGWTSSQNVHSLKSGVMTLFARICLDGLE